MIQYGYDSHQDPLLAVPPDEPEPTPAECMELCTHYPACRAQYERHQGAFDDEQFASEDVLASLLGCGESCEWMEDA